MSRRVGLTGGIGSGKSTVSRRLAELGAVIIDADAIAREVVAAGSPGLAAVVARFGSGVLSGDGSIDRARLASIVFSDDAALKDLNAIIHPLVRQRAAELEAAADEAVVVHDIPLLVENGADQGFDDLVVVQAPVELRITRLAGRGMGGDEARARMAKQASDEQRRAAATVLLDNSGSQAALMGQVDALWRRWTSASAG